MILVKGLFLFSKQTQIYNCMKAILFILQKNGRIGWKQILLVGLILLFTVSVKAQEALDVNFTFDNNQCSGTILDFTSTVQGGTPTYTYEWNFGGQGTSTEKNPKFSFNSTGCGTSTAKVTLKVTDSKGVTKSVDKDIIIKQSPQVDFIDDFNNCMAAGSIVGSYTPTLRLNGTPSGCISSYQIDWGDGSSIENLTSSSFPYPHTYAQQGAFDLKISTIGTNGCTTKKTYIVKNMTNPSTYLKGQMKYEQSKNCADYSMF